MAEATQSDIAQEIPTDKIKILDGFNARSFFDEEAATSLENSIRKKGVLQNIVVRPVGDGFELAAGERRLRAAKKVGLAVIPAIVRDMSDDEMTEVMHAENSERQNLSAAEESRLAQRVLTEVDGDREEAAARLGWAKSKVDRRLLLLHAHSDVLDALARRQIKIGHAELLSMRPESQQVASLPTLIKEGFTVAQLRDKLVSRVQDLSEAPFDLKGCFGCQHNSSTQAGLFGADLGEAKCSNQPCYEKKRIECVEAKKAEAADEYNVIHLDVERDPDSYITLQKLGDKGVGPTQFAACKGCGDHGAVMLSKPGKEGEVIEGQCFNLSCNKGMVKAYAEARGEAKSDTQNNDATADAASTSAAKPASNGAKSGAKKASSKAKAVSKPAASKHAVSAHDEALVKRIANTDMNGRIDAYASTLGLIGLVGFHAVGQIASIPHIKGSSFPTVCAALIDLDDKQLREVREAAFKHYVADAGQGDRDFGTGKTRSVLVAAVVARDQQMNMAGAVKIDEKYLGSLTKMTIEDVCRKSGYAEHLAEREADATVDGVMSALMSKKKPEIVKAIVDDESFDWSGYLPDELAATINGKKAK